MSIKKGEAKALAKVPEWVIDVERASIAWSNQTATGLFVESSQQKKQGLPAISSQLHKRLVGYLRALENGPMLPLAWHFNCPKNQTYLCHGQVILLGPDHYGIRVRAQKVSAPLDREPCFKEAKRQAQSKRMSLQATKAAERTKPFANAFKPPLTRQLNPPFTKQTPFALNISEFGQILLAVFDAQGQLEEASDLFHTCFSKVKSLKDIFVLNSDYKKVFHACNRFDDDLDNAVWQCRLQSDQGVRWHQIECRFDPITKRSALLFQDIHLQRDQENQLFKLKYYDSLTGLANRHLLYKELEVALVDAKENNGQFGVLYLDLDGFKVVNDSFGHRVGDELIVQVAKRLVISLPKGGRLFRLGGDEFALLQKGVQDPQSLEVLAQHLMQVACAAYPIAKMEMLITASIGIAHYPNHGTDVDTLLKRADVAMYRAKSIGHNTYRMYDANMSQSLNAYLTLGGGLRRAIENQEFELFYQPKVRLSDQITVGAEALIRWQHPEFGMISPDRFIPIAEETGLILPLGEWVIREACEQLRRWREEGHTDITLSVNLSGRQFMQADLVNMVQQVLMETGVDPKNLELELTESMLMADAHETIEKLHGFRELGLTLSIDDFGTGYSSLAYLKKFPIQTLKIDRSFVRDLGSNSDDDAIVKATIAMATSLNLKVIAEGVENGSQLNVLKDYECQEVQGYLFAKPMSSQDFSLYMKQELGRFKPSLAAVH